MRFLMIFVLIVSAPVIAQPQEQSDACQVSFTDLTAARRALEKDGEVETKILGTFKTKIGEEEVTTRHFQFPNSNQYVTASVGYTDESMRLQKPGRPSVDDSSIALGLAVSGKREVSAFGVEGNATAEVNYDDNTLEVRVRKVAQINGLPYAIGLECLCNGAKRQP